MLSLEFNSNLITQKLVPYIWIVYTVYFLFLLIAYIHYVGSFYLVVALSVVEHIKNCNLSISHIVVLIMYISCWLKDLCLSIPWPVVLALKRISTPNIFVHDSTYDSRLSLFHMYFLYSTFLHSCYKILNTSQ